MRVAFLLALLSALTGCASWRQQAATSWDTMTLPQAIVTAALILSAALLLAVRMYAEQVYEDDNRE